jgi:DNA-binding transcriptional ArsR family regulator
MGKAAGRQLLEIPAEAQENKLHVSEVPRIQTLLVAEDFKLVAFLAKSLSDENRLRILGFLSNGKKSVSSIVEELGLSQPLVSHHLRELKRSLLVKIERSGPFIYYEVSDPRIMGVARILSEVANDLLSLRKIY